MELNHSLMPYLPSVCCSSLGFAVEDSASQYSMCVNGAIVDNLIRTRVLGRACGESVRTQPGNKMAQFEGCDEQVVVV
jgi:hypothetical protein